MGDAQTPFTLRLATLKEVPVLQDLIAESVRVLQANDYTDEQRESAIRVVYGVDTQLIRDGTYFAVDWDRPIVACGGWSRRKTLFGGDQHRPTRADSLLDPAREPARIRAFFIRPGWERRGIGSALVRACEQAAIAEGFRQMEMASTLTGVALYSVHGYREAEHIDVPLEHGLVLPVIRMIKTIGSSVSS
jgi:GNAT superfamily N-acetyltransferase